MQKHIKIIHSYIIGVSDKKYFTNAFVPATFSVSFQSHFNFWDKISKFLRKYLNRNLKLSSILIDKIQLYQNIP